MMRWFGRHARLLTLLLGSGTVSIWTVYRHSTNGINFDVVGQIGLADQWTHDLHAGGQLGATNYLLKIPLYMVVNTLGFLSPMNRILLLALICNIATFLLLMILFEKILKLYRVTDQRWLYLALLWLATISGSVFWVDYANSRNLETVGGVLFVFLILKHLKQPSQRTAALAALAGSVVFFADSLQLYVCGAGVCVYAVLRWLHRRNRTTASQGLQVVGLTAISYVGALFLNYVARHLLHVSFLVAPHEKVSFGIATIRGVARSTLDIFGANVTKKPYDLSTIRELLGLLLLIAGVWVISRTALKSRTRTVIWTGLVIVAANYLVYIASGQVLVWATARYLILVPLLLALILATTGDKLSHTFQRRFQLGWLMVLCLSIIMLIGALAVKWPDRHAKDARIYTTVAFLESNHVTYSLSSREVGVTTTYFAQGKATVLPMLCGADHRLSGTDLFYDRAAFQQARTSSGSMSVIVPIGGITTGKFVCGVQDVVAQFGPPEKTLDVAGLGNALQYPSAVISPSLALPVTN